MEGDEATADAISATIPTAFSKATVLLKQNELSNHSDSLSMEMMQDSSLKYNFPFCHIQSGSQNRFNVGIINTDYVIKTQLLGFLSSDLIGILFSVVYTGDETRKSDGHVNPLYMRDIKDVKVEYNGQVLMDYPGKLLELDMLTQCEGDNRTNVSVLDTVGQTPLAQSAYVHYIQFTQHKNISFKEEFNNTEQYSSQPLDLTFTVNIASTPKLGDYILHTTYLYNGYCSTSGGVTRVMIG